MIIMDLLRHSVFYKREFLKIYDDHKMSPKCEQSKSKSFHGTHWVEEEKNNLNPDWSHFTKMERDLC